MMCDPLSALMGRDAVRRESINNGDKAYKTAAKHSARYAALRSGSHTEREATCRKLMVNGECLRSKNVGWLSTFQLEVALVYQCWF
jgi:hypothetical protein